MRPKKGFKLTFPEPKVAHLARRKLKTNRKSGKNLKSQLKETHRIKFFSFFRVDTKTHIEPYPNLKNGPSGLQKAKNDPKNRSNRKSEFRGT